MQLTVLYFGAVREALGISTEILTLKRNSVAEDVRSHLIVRLPQIAGLLKRSAIAVNQNYVQPEHTLADGDEVAILPPVSGGALSFV